MNRDQLIAQAEALDMVRTVIEIDGGGGLGKWLHDKADELRAQAEAMNNGAARQVEQSPGEVAPITGTAASIPAAAPPSTTQPVAQVVCNPDGSDKRVIFHSHRALYETPLGTFLYAAPPDLAARVKRLDGLLNEAASVITDIHSIVPLKFAVVALLERIRAALAEGK